MVVGDCQRLTKFETLTLQINNETVERKTSCKYLEAILDENWSWKLHLFLLVKRLGDHLAIFHRIRYHLDITSKVAYFNGLVLPHMDYISILWGD